MTHVDRKLREKRICKIIMSKNFKNDIQFQGNETWISNYGNQILIYLNISIFYIYVFSVAGRNLIFYFNFQATSATGQALLKTLTMIIENQQISCKFHFFGGLLFFFCHIKMPKHPTC